MPRRRASHFNLATFTALAVLLPLLTVGLNIVSDWILKGNKLEENTKAIASIEKRSLTDRAEEQKKREEIRDQYFTYQQKTNEILSKLDTRLAVSETKQEVANQTLSKIVDQLSRISTFSK